MLDREETIAALSRWNDAWNDHDLDRVMELLHDEVEFENWTGGRVAGKEALRKEVLDHLQTASRKRSRRVRGSCPVDLIARSVSASLSRKPASSRRENRPVFFSA